jgi:hypothetical protein
MMASEVADLPQPLSPTMASVRPGCTAKDTWSTARIVPRSVRKSTQRRSTSSAGIGWSVITAT